MTFPFHHIYVLFFKQSFSSLFFLLFLETVVPGFGSNGDVGRNVCLCAHTDVQYKHPFFFYLCLLHTYK